MFEENQLVKCRNDVLEVVSTNELFLLQKNRAQRQFEYLTNHKEISELSILNFNENVEYLNKLADIYGFTGLNIVCPSKPVILSNELAAAGIKVNSIFKKYFSEGSSLYPLRDLLKHNSTRKLDTHYSGIGQWQLVISLLEKLNLNTSFVQPMFDIKEQGGDLANMLCIESKNYETVFSSHATKGVYTNKNALSGNTGHIIYKINSESIYGKRLVIFGDSFIVQCLDILSMFFDEVIYFRNSFVLEDVVRVLNPDIVITQQAERYLVNVPNFRTSVPYLFKFLNSSYNPQLLDKSFLKATEALFSPRDSKLYKNWRNSIK
jgi:hypothetical protein